jgi:hypothetical protein
MTENGNDNTVGSESSQLPNGILIKSISDQEVERLKFISCLGTLLEEFAEVEHSTSRSFGKIISSFVSGKQDSLAGFGAILEEISKFSTQAGGKNHAAIANNITSNVCKTFPEYSKLNRKKVHVILQKLYSIQEDLKKAKIVQTKNEENYSRLVKEAEMCIRFRDNPDLYEKAMETDRDSVDEKDKFKNMSFSKMISKMTTNDKKSPSERVADIVREVELEERQLEANSKRLSFCRANLLVEIDRSMSEILAIERTRVLTLIDGFMKVFAIFDQFNHKIGESANSIDHQLTNFKFDSSLYIPGDLLISECSGLSFIPAEEWTDELESIHSGVPQVAVKVERFLDMLENSIQYVQKTHQLFDEVTDVERSRNRSFKKLLEKYDAVTTGELLSTTATADSMCKLNKFFASELSELFPVRQMTASLVLLMRIMSDISARSGDLSMEDICKDVGAAQKRIVNLRKELKDGYSSFLRNMESNYIQYTKLRVKLQKTQAFLKERNLTVKQAKLNAGIGGDSVSADASSVAGETSEPIVNVSGTVDDSISRAVSPPAERRSSAQFASVVSAAVNANALAQQQGNGETSAVTAEGNNSLYRMTSMKNKFENFGSSLRSATKLKQVVGLESPSDRVHRIENQIVAIEKEERELQAQSKKSFEELKLFMSQSSMDLVNRLMASKTDLLSDLDQVKNALHLYVDWGKERRQLLGNGLADLKIRLDACEKVVDQELFSANPENIVVKFEIPDIEAFVPIKSEIYNEERKKLRTSIDRVSSIESAAGLTSPKTPRTSIVLTTEPLAPEPDLMMPADTMQMYPRVSVSSSMLLRADDIDSDDEVLADEASQTSTIQGSGDNSSSRKASNADLLPSPPVESPALTPSSPIVEVKKAVTTEVEATNEMSSSTPSPPPPPAIPNPSVPVSLVPTIATVPTTPATNNAVSVGADHELRRFGLDPSDKVLESFSCALYPKRGILTHGRLFITQHYLAFSGWPDTRVLLSLACVKKVEKTNTLMYIPNAISIICLIDNSTWAAATNEAAEDPCEEEFFFGSFIERELCFNLIRNLSEIEKRIVEIASHTNADEGSDLASHILSKPPLEFGYQTHTAIFSWRGNDSTPVTNPQSVVVPEDSRAAAPNQTKERVETPTQVANESNLLLKDNVVNPRDELIAIPEASIISKAAVSSTPAAQKSSPITIQQSIISSTPSATLEEEVETITVKKKKIIKAKGSISTGSGIPASVTIDNNQLKKLESMIADHHLIVLAKKAVPFACHHFFLSNLRYGNAYTKYLETQNDFDISNTEWEPFSESVPEDVTKTAFRWKRRFNNMHPRTTMLMFGPKNCSVKQDQYLSLLVSTDVAGKMGSLSFDQIRVYGGVLLTIYEFDGIPMGDVFKVLQYYIFTPATVLHRDGASGVATISSNGNENGSQVTVGLTIHFRKSTMFRSQIISGSSEESGAQARNWLEGAEKKVEADIAEFLKIDGCGMVDGEESEEIEEEITETVFKSDTLRSSDAGDRHASDLTRRCSFGRMPMGLSAEEQKSVLSNAANSILENTIASIRKEYDWQLLLRDRTIIGLVATILLLALYVLYLYYNTNFKVAALEKLLQKQFASPN